jgi:hypothetical protein
VNDAIVAAAATGLIDTVAEPWRRAVVVVFEPALPERHALYANAAAADLIPVLKAVLERLESGTLRMPLEVGVRWVDVEVGEEG